MAPKSNDEHLMSLESHFLFLSDWSDVCEVSLMGHQTSSWHREECHKHKQRGRVLLVLKKIDQRPQLTLPSHTVTQPDVC